jgi:hypothetical protein
MNHMTPQQMQHRLQHRAETLELLNAEITASLDRQAASAQRLETKSVLLVGYAGAAASFLATRHNPQHLLAALAYLAFGASAGAGIWAYAVRLYQDVPEPRRLFTTYLPKSRPQTLAALASTRVEAFEANAAKRARKARRWWISLASLTLGMALMIAALTAAYW